MHAEERKLVRIADRIRRHLLLRQRTRYRYVQGKLGSIVGELQRFEAIRRKLDICESRGWHGAALKVLQQVERACGDMPHLLQGVTQTAQGCKTAVPSTAEVYRELLQAEEEFDELVVSKAGDMVAVETDSIELEGLYLGPFQIQLHLSALAEMRLDNAYDVVALHPQPATRNPVVTHPHVSDERLCAGDATAAINAALAGGRVCDFFLLVRSVLTTYNPDSPYVSIEEWHGRPCYECGYTVNPDETYWCVVCKEEYCGECASYCRVCDETVCLGCLDKCEACEDPVCPSCLTKCPECDRSICKTCLDEVLCPCHEEEETEDEPQEQAAPAGAAGRTEAA